MSNLEDKVVLISGGARGMGAACARRLVGAGARVAVGDVLAEEAADLAAQLGDRCRPVALDVTRPASWTAAVAETVDAFGRLTGLVTNAGILRRTPIPDGDLDVYDRVVAVNQTGVYLGMRAAAGALAATGGGSIVNVSSIDGLLGMRRMAAYVAAKWAVRGMTKVAALELAPLGIRCNSVHPGYIDTPMLTVGGRMTQATKDALAAQVPSGALGDPDDVAAVVAFLLGDESRYCNGAELVVDGGLIAGLQPAAPA